MRPAVGGEGWHQGRHVADDEEVARPRAADDGGVAAAVGAGDHHHLRPLALQQAVEKIGISAEMRCAELLETRNEAAQCAVLRVVTMGRHRLR